MGNHARGHVEEMIKEIDLNETETAIVEALKEGPCSTSDLLDKIGLKSRTGAFRRNLKKLMDHVVFEYLYPDNPKHPEQKYRLKTPEK